MTTHRINPPRLPEHHAPLDQAGQVYTRDALPLEIAHGITQPGQATPHGRKYEVWGTLRHGDGIALRVLTVWIVTAPGRAPRFVTLIPRR